MLLTIGVAATASASWGPWPSPGGDEQAAIALPPSGDRLFGANDDYERRRGRRLLETLSAAGANTARRTLSWWHTEPARDVWGEASWSAASRYHEGAIANGMTPIHMLAFAPPWARKRGTRGCLIVGRCEFPPRRAMIGEWAEFAAEAARRFPGAVFEIWNEANILDFWQPSPDPELWAELVVAASAAIKGVDPDAIVIACGCAPVLGDDGRPATMQLDEFLTRAYAHDVSIRGAHDGISVHLFPQTGGIDGAGPARPLSFGRRSMLAGLLATVRSAATEGGEQPQPVWITEAGYWTRSRAHPGSELSEREVARTLSRLVRRVYSASGIRALLIHRAQDTGHPDRSELGTREASFGLVRKGRELLPKPSLCVFAGLAGAHGRPGCAGISGPAIELRERPRGGVTPGAERFRVAAPDETATIECSLDGGPFVFCGDRFVARVFRSGRHLLRARALDAAGNAGLEARARWRVRARGPRGPRRCTVIGTAGDDRLRGTPGRDIICGLDGNDVISGGRGGDLIAGGPGSDRIRGGRGSDRLVGDLGVDELRGGGGPDLLLGGHGADLLFGGRGSDRLSGGGGPDRLDGGAGADSARGGRGKDRGSTERYADSGAPIIP